MKRGDIVTVSLPGDYGKPRPALIIQSDLFNEHPSVTVLPVTSHLRETPIFRITIEPSKENGLNKISQVMIDKAHTVNKEKVGKTFGKIDSKTFKENGLNKISQVMIDKAHTVNKEKVGKTFGKIDSKTLLIIDRALALFLGYCD